MLASSSCIRLKKKVHHAYAAEATVQVTNPSYFVDGEQGELHTAATGTLQTTQQELTGTAA
jgi:hypothetical protein